MSRKKGKVILLAEQHLNSTHLQTIQSFLARLAHYCAVLAVEQPLAEITPAVVESLRPGTQSMARRVSSFAHRHSLPDPTLGSYSGDELEQAVRHCGEREGVARAMYVQWPYGVAMRALIQSALTAKFPVHGFDCDDAQLNTQSAPALQQTSDQLVSRLQNTLMQKNAFMAQRLAELSQQGHVFAIMGFAHVAGVYQRLMEERVDVCVVSANNCLTLSEGADYALTASPVKRGFFASLPTVFNQPTYAYQIRGLEKRPELNGERVYFVGHHANGRIIVRRTVGEARRLKIKPENLRRPVLQKKMLKLLPDDYKDEPPRRSRCCGLRLF